MNDCVVLFIQELLGKKKKTEVFKSTFHFKGTGADDCLIHSFLKSQQKTAAAQEEAEPVVAEAEMMV